VRVGDDNGSIAVIAAVVIPVVLLVIALALSTLVWSVSESEVQRASDSSAVRAASSAALVDFPYSSITSLSPVLYPSLSGVVPSQLLPTLPTVTPCSTIGNPVGAVSGLLNPGGLLGAVLSGLGVGAQSALTTAVNALPAPTRAVLTSLPASCTGLGSIAPFPSVPNYAVTDSCTAAAAAMTDDTAPYSTRYFAGTSGQTQPTCANGRVRIGFATGSPLLGFGNTSASIGDHLQLAPATGLATVQSDLAPLGVHLDTSLPNALCPSINVEVDQPVRGPVLPRTSNPNGRSTARRVVKNAVVVPVFNGMSLPAAPGAAQAVLSASGQASVVNGATTVPAVNLNTALLAPLQQTLLGVLDTMDASINSTLTTANAGVSVLNGTTSAVNATGAGTLPAPLPAVNGNVGSLDLLSCLRRTLRQIYNPPTGDAPTVNEVLAAAAQEGDPIIAVQVGVMACNGAANATAALSCVQAALPQAPGSPAATAAATLGKATGLYDVPFLDVTPMMIRDIGSGNFMAVPVHASQANGAFRAGLVRSTDERYAP